LHNREEQNSDDKRDANQGLRKLEIFVIKKGISQRIPGKTNKEQKDPYQRKKKKSNQKLPADG